MTPQPAGGQGVNETYEILRRAAARRQPVAAIYDDLPRLLCPHVLGRKAGRYMRWSIRLAGGATADCRWCRQKQVFGAAWPWRNSVRLSCARMDGAQGHASRRQTCVEEVDFDTDAQPGDDPQKGQ